MVGSIVFIYVFYGQLTGFLFSRPFGVIFEVYNFLPLCLLKYILINLLYYRNLEYLRKLLLFNLIFLSS